MKGCPLGINVPGFIRSLREGNVDSAYAKIREESCLSSICGRICTAPCEAACVLTDEGLPIGIRALERYASDYGKNRPAKFDNSSKSGIKIAVVGSGPSGLMASFQLAQKGYQVTIFESLDKPGGVLRYGIPEFRLPKKYLDQEINHIKALGVKIVPNFFLGYTASLEGLFDQGYEAVLLATGAGIPKLLDMPGTSFGGVYYGEEFLIRTHRLKDLRLFPHTTDFPFGIRVAVIGSGNTALDCARLAVRYGREVSLVFSSEEGDLHVNSEECIYAQEEGVRFESRIKPVEILGDAHHFVTGLKCVRMDYADPDGSGKWQVVEVPGSDFALEVDTVIIATGHNPNSLLVNAEKRLKVNDDGTFKVGKDNGMTTISRVFAAGNVRTNAGPVVEAMASGKRAAEQIDLYLKERIVIEREEDA